MKEDIYSQNNLQKLLDECYDEIENTFKDTVYANYFDFKKDNIKIKAEHTSGRILGNCHYDDWEYVANEWGYKRTRVIKSATITICRHKNRTENGIKETIIHELIHTLKNCQNHKSEFKWYCEIIQKYLGYSCLSGQHEDTKSNEYLENYKHFLVCTYCNKIVRKGTRFTKPYQRPDIRRCCTCGKCEIEYKNLEQIKELVKVWNI